MQEALWGELRVVFQKAGVEMRDPFSGRQREAAEGGLGAEEEHDAIFCCKWFTLQNGLEGSKEDAGRWTRIKVDIGPLGLEEGSEQGI